MSVIDAIALAGGLAPAVVDALPGPGGVLELLAQGVPGAPGGGGPGRGLGLGMALMPIGILMALLRQPAGPVKVLLDAGAESETTARRLQSVGIVRESSLDFARGRGIAVRLDDGRWYVDRAAERRFRRRIAVAAVVGCLALGLAIWFGWDVIAGPPRS